MVLRIMMVMMTRMVTVVTMSHHAMWQLQLKGFDIRFREVRDASSSKAPGVTQLISFPNKLKLFRLFRPCNIACKSSVDFETRAQVMFTEVVLKTECEKLP